MRVQASVKRLCRTLLFILPVRIQFILSGTSSFSTAFNARSLASATTTGCTSACSAVSQMYSSLEHTYKSHTPPRKYLPKPHPDTPVPNLRLSESLQHIEV